MVKAANVTKYDAGGTGDNVISDGFIKSVEKVWMDSYAFTAAIASDSVLDIAVLPENKKVTSIELQFNEALSTGASATGTTISLGARIAAGTTDSTIFLSAGEAATGVLNLTSNAGMQYVTTGGVNVITVLFDRIATTTTAGTITSIVRYT